MAQFVKLVPENLKALREVNPRLMSYNVEFAEVTGGTFWKAYTPEQVAGTEEFHVAPSADGIAAMYKDLMQVYAPIDLYNEKLRSLAKELGTAWVRVSGTWATKTYYDFDNTTGGGLLKCPDKGAVDWCARLRKSDRCETDDFRCELPGSAFRRGTVESE